MKVYVQENKIETTDGDILVQVLTYKSRPKHFKYIIFV